MELTLHVAHDFVKMNVDEKLSFGPLAHDLMLANVLTFDKPKPTLAEIATANENLLKANQDYNQFGESKRQALEEAETEWIRLFRQEASYVDGVANGVGSIIQLSGFHITKTESTPAQKPGMLQNVDVFGDSRQKGLVHAQTQPMHGAKGYLAILSSPDVEVTVNGEQMIFKMGNSVVSIAAGTHKSFEMNLLPSKTEMKARMAAFNTAGMGDVSTPQDVNIA